MIEATPEQVGLSSERLARVDAWRERWVASGKLAGVSTMMMRHGQVVHVGATGFADAEREAPMTPETIVRIYSMTKPLTSVAIMMLYEEGRFQLDDPISKFIPAFAQTRVFTGGMWGKLETEPAARGITFRDLLTHTSGLTYGFIEATPVGAMYRQRNIDFTDKDSTLAELAERLAALPLMAQPGQAWNYSVATDVLGYLVEVISGQAFDRFLHERVIAPLGMVDTAFHVPDEKLPRFAANYQASADGGRQLIDDPQTSPYRHRPKACSGGGGLVSTLPDYMRFCRMMLGRGTLDGVRLLGRKTVELMTSNHLRGDMAAMGTKRFSESSYEGIGFGLGFSVMLDLAKAQILGSPGEYAWGGAASTAFWIDPVEDLAVVLFTQLMPSSTYAIRKELRVLTYGAVVD